jgi:hypothetical protein
VGRLENIVERNQHPRRHRKHKFPVGIALSLFVLVVLVLLIFTDLATPKQTPRDHTRVNDIQLRSAPPTDARGD